MLSLAKGNHWIYIKSIWLTLIYSLNSGSLSIFFCRNVDALRLQLQNRMYEVIRGSCRKWSLQTRLIQVVSQKNIQFSIFNWGESKQSTGTAFQRQNIIFLCVRRFLNGIIPWSGVKVMVHWVMSGKKKVGYFRHYYESHGSSPTGKTHSNLR